MTGGAAPGDNTVLGVLPILLVPFPRLFAMASVLGISLRATLGSGGGTQWPAWQILPASRAVIERHAIQGMLVLGLGFMLVDIAGAILWVMLNPPATAMASSPGLVPAIFGAFLAPTMAAALHIVCFRRGTKRAKGALWAILAVAWLLGPMLAANQGLCFVSVSLLGLDLPVFAALDAPARVILMLLPTLTISSAAWLAWLAATQLVWRPR